MEYIIIWLLFAIFSAVIANNKKRSTVGWFLIGFFFGPFGLLVAVLSPKDIKPCPFCGEDINIHAIVCKHCKSKLIP